LERVCDEKGDHLTIYLISERREDGRGPEEGRACKREEGEVSDGQSLDDVFKASFWNDLIAVKM
jgi:hypothetical protein